MNINMIYFKPTSKARKASIIHENLKFWEKQPITFNEIFEAIEKIKDTEGFK